MRFARSIGANNVIVSCMPELAPQAEALLDKLADLDRRGPPLVHGSTIDFGWTRLTLLGAPDELMVWEPLYDGDAERDKSPRLDDTLQVITEQTAVLQRLGEQGIAAWYLDKVVLGKGAFASPRIYLERKPTTNSHDSGWYIGAVDERSAALPVSDYEAVWVYQLLDLRRSVMQVLALPPGYLVVIDGDYVEAVIDESGRDRWTA